MIPCENRNYPYVDIAMAQNIHRITTISKKPRYIKKFIVWVPHELIVNHLLNQIFICNSLLKRNDIKVLGRESLGFANGRKVKILNDNDNCLVELIWNCLL